MIEILFEESLRGSLAHAQNYGNGPYPGGYSFITYYNEDGSLMTEEQAKIAGDLAEAAEKIRWEEATPLGGSFDDVFNFGEKFNLGDLSSKTLSEYDTENLQKVISRINNGEEARIWYSDLTDQACSFLWLMNQLKKANADISKISVVHKDSWQGTKPGDWHKFVGEALPLSKDFFAECTSLWESLIHEGASVRVFKDGRVVSVSDDYYDESIIDIARSMKEQPFMENHLIGEVNYIHPELEYGWIFKKIEHLISEGVFLVTEEPIGSLEDFKYITVK